MGGSQVGIKSNRFSIRSNRCPNLSSACAPGASLTSRDVLGDVRNVRDIFLPLMVIPALGLWACNSSNQPKEAASHKPKDPTKVMPVPVTSDAAAKVVPRTVERAWGIAMPSQTRRVFSQEKMGHHGQSESALWLASDNSPSDVMTHFANIDGATEPYTLAGSPCIDFLDVRICVNPAEEIPMTIQTPVVAIVSAVPPSAKAWVFLYRSGAPTPCPPCPAKFTGTLKPGCGCP